MVVYRLLSLSCAGWLECGDVKRPTANPDCRNLNSVSDLLNSHSLQRTDTVNKLSVSDTEGWTLTCQTRLLSR